jgi:alkylhydroperoxidase family enzyme
MKRHLLFVVALSAAFTAGAFAESVMAPGSAQERARMKEILGQPPRLAPRTDLTPDERAIVAPPKGFEDAGAVPPIFAILLHNPGLARRYIPMASQFMVDGQLAPRDRELTILRNGWLMQAPFIWGEHVQVSKKFGVTSADIEAVTRGSSDPRWNAHDRAVLKAVEELTANSMISDPTWAELAKGMNEAQLVELPIMVGQYKSLAYFANSLRIELRSGNPGLAGR